LRCAVPPIETMRLPEALAARISQIEIRSEQR
jgi:hypothetical protein